MVGARPVHYTAPMLPAQIVGTLTLNGEVQPFVLETASGEVTLGVRRDADPMQRHLAADARQAAVARVAEQVPGAEKIAL